MPELPEVETIRRGLIANIINKKISGLEIRKSKLVKNNDQVFKSVLKNKSIVNISRIGKLLIFELSGDKFLFLIHLKMTGQLIYVDKSFVLAGGHSFKQPDILPNKFSHVIFSFADGSKLFFNDLRQFGYLRLLKKSELKRVKDNFGIEPGQNNFNLENFSAIFENKKIKLKALLLNQKLIAGLGNIYADEVCWRAGLRPDRVVNSLSKAEIKKLFLATNYIIKKAIAKRGTTFSDYRDAQNKKGNFSKYLKVYGRQGEKCQRCNFPIKKLKLVGRGTHFCPNCQK
ncbi:MAG: bifunctional DNA-formamidopyrimidine glycosylase/DNA-(apurinic or apyrimidinic site) lyase [bacterium]|nr:bifunctional DNA-formamidopyrimidine glycosylase/DNA-(apurinic or apyrimidinic site) lyase [bacterium]